MTEEFNDEKQGVSSWIQDNLRIVISIVIVIFLAGTIYSYSNRSVEEVAVEDDQIQETISEEEILEDILNQELAEEEAIEEEAVTEEEAVEAEVVTEEVIEEEAVTEEEAVEEEIVVEEEATEEVAEETTIDAQEISAIQTSQETEESFIESAQAGEGTTHLARRALSNYLEKNPDSNLTQEHKVYIEDYLRKKVDFQDNMHIGTSVEFSKSLIQEAIASSEQLTDSQIQNLHKYAVLIN
ncbi:hypothetical protein ACFL08_03610 [Patescibacteria group bacterium]